MQRHETTEKVIRVIIDLLREYREKIESIEPEKFGLLAKFGIVPKISDFCFATREIAEKTGLHEKTVYFCLKALERAGMLESYSKKWFLNRDFVKLFS